MLTDTLLSIGYVQFGDFLVTSCFKKYLESLGWDPVNFSLLSSDERIELMQVFHAQRAALVMKILDFN